MEETTTKIGTELEEPLMDPGYCRESISLLKETILSEILEEELKEGDLSLNEVPDLA